MVQIAGQQTGFIMLQAILCKNSGKGFTQNHKNRLSENQDWTDSLLVEMESVMDGKKPAPELPTVLPKQDSLVKKPGFHILSSLWLFYDRKGRGRQSARCGSLGVYFTHTWWPRKTQYIQKTEVALIAEEEKANHSIQNQHLKM